MFNKFVGPAYKKNMYYDMRMDNGLNSNNSIIKRIKVIEIKAVKKLPDGQYTDPELYWFYDETGTVYDHEMDYPIGKVKLIDNVPEKLNKDTLIISKIVNIPMIKRRK